MKKGILLLGAMLLGTIHASAWNGEVAIETPSIQLLLPK